MIFSVIRIGSEPARTDRHRLAGITKINGVPGPQLVAIFDRITLALVAAKISHQTTGAWELSGLPEYPSSRLSLVVFDLAGAYNSETADLLTQVTS